MIIRSASAHDAGTIVWLFRRGIEAAHRPLTIAGCPGYEHYIRSHIQLRNRGGDHRYWVAEVEGEVVGAIEFRSIGCIWFLNNIHVDGNKRGLGIGRGLLAKAARYGLGIGHTELALDVLETNVRAAGWYSSLGLREQTRASYCSMPLPEHVPSAKGTIANLPQAVKLFHDFGFATVVVRGVGEHEVGILGQRWYRLSKDDIVDDILALEALRVFDPDRRLLLITATGVKEGRPWDLLARSIRMSGALQDVVGVLER